MTEGKRGKRMSREYAEKYMGMVISGYSYLKWETTKKQEKEYERCKQALSVLKQEPGDREKGNINKEKIRNFVSRTLEKTIGGSYIPMTWVAEQLRELDDILEEATNE